MDSTRHERKIGGIKALTESVGFISLAVNLPDGRVSFLFPSLLN